MKGSFKPFAFIPTGDIDFPQVQTNFEALDERIKAIEDDVSMITKRRYTFTRLHLIEDIPVTVLEAKDHENAKLISAFAMVADNSHRTQEISLVNGDEKISEKLVLKEGEKAGKVQELTIIPYRKVSRHNTVTCLPDGSRKAMLCTNWGEI